MKPPKFNLNIDYFPENDFSAYRKDMLNAINISSITSSFNGLRELSSHLGKLKNDEYSLNDLISILENNKKNKVVTQSNEKKEVFEKSFAEKNTEKIIDFQKKSENTNQLDLEALEIKKKNYEKDAILLNNLEHYIHENIKEIKDFKNLFGKGKTNQEVDPANSYNPRENEIVEVNLGEKEKLSQKLLRMQQKSKENEINVLIQRITNFQKKEEILAEKIALENSKINRMINFLTKNLHFNEILIGDISNFDEENINYNQIKFSSKFLLIDLDKFIFFDTDLGSIHLEIPHNQVSSFSIIVNNNKFSYITEHDEFNPNKFSGFLINYWEEQELKAIILKNKSYFEQRKLDMVLFMVQLMNSLKTKSIIYKTFLSNADLNNSNCNYSINRINSEVCAKDELLNLTPTSNKMKDSAIKHKKTIQFVLPEPTLIEQSREDTEEKRKKILAKLEELDYKDQLKKSMKLNNVNLKTQASKLKLMNGFVFKLKKKINKSEEIYIFLDTSKSEYFFCLSVLHGVGKKKIISLKNAFNLKKWNFNEDGETFFGINIISNNTVIELQASDEKNMECFFECCQNILNDKREN